MNEKELFKFGEHQLNTDSLIKNIQSNQESFMNYYSNEIQDSQLFSEKLDYIKNGIKDGSITVNEDGKYADSKGKINDNDQLMQYALGYVNLIATEQSKKERSLTKSEIAKKEEDKKRKKEELARQRAEKEDLQHNTKPDFTPQDGWSVAASFAHSFNQNGQIPYDLLQQLITQDDKGNSVYTNLHAQLDKNFDSVSKQLEAFNGTESYINNINLFKQALKDGDLSPQDRFLGMELGFQNSELDKLNALIKYKIKPGDPTPPEEKEEIVTTPTIELKQDPLESDDDFYKRVEASQRTKNYVINALKHINFDQFNSSKSIKLDSELEFKKHLIQYMNSELLKTQNPNFVYTKYHGTPFGHYQNTSLVQKINEDHLQYMDPKLYNELGLKFFSKYSKSNMYKHFKDLVDKQNQEKIVEKIEYDDPTRDLSVQYMYKEGGIIKAQGGTQTPWRRNFNQGVHQMDAIYDTFTKNADSYDAKLIADSLNKLNSNDFSSLNFEQADNTLGFKNWNTTFNESGLNNLFGYNEGKSDYLGPTTKSRQGFVSYLQNLYDASNPNKVDSIKTGNGSLVFNPETKQWSYTDWVDPSTKGDPNEQQGNGSDGQGSENSSGDGGTGDGTGSTGTGVLPKTGDLSLKELTLKKKANLNKNGIIHSLAGYIANDAANREKRELATQIPLYQEVNVPEKTFKTPYTYDLEVAKNKAFAEANSLQPMTSDVFAYYVAKNDAIKNARDYAERLDFKINDLIHEAGNYNRGVAYENALARTTNANTNAKYRHQWEVEQLDFEDQFIDAQNKSFQGLLKESKYNTVMAQRKKEKLQDHYTNKSLLTSIKTSPSNYIKGWSKYHDDIWTRGQNNQLTTTQEQIDYAQLLSLIGQAYDNAYAQYTGIDYVGAGNLSVSDILKEQFDPKKHGKGIFAAKGAKLNRSRINDFLNKIK